MATLSRTYTHNTRILSIALDPAPFRRWIFFLLLFQKPARPLLQWAPCLSLSLCVCDLLDFAAHGWWMSSCTHRERHRVHNVHLVEAYGVIHQLKCVYNKSFIVDSILIHPSTFLAQLFASSFFLPSLSLSLSISKRWWMIALELFCLCDEIYGRNCLWYAKIRIPYFSCLLKFQVGSRLERKKEKKMNQPFADIMV